MTKGNGDHRLNAQNPALHLAIIMDGSGRWAAARGLPREEGHRAGRAAVRRTMAAALEQGIGVLTLFSFSTDNWGRPQNEVAQLMRTFESFLRVDAPALLRRGIRIKVMGRRDRLPFALCDAISKIEAANPAAGRLLVRLAIDYSGRDAILEAAREWRQSTDPCPEGFLRLLTEAEPDAEPVRDVDLLIRTGGELRLSNCPLWDIAYAELYFTACMWPDFGPAELDAALQEYHTRDRRFGQIPRVATQAGRL